LVAQKNGKTINFLPPPPPSIVAVNPGSGINIPDPQHLFALA
jgi:hypothetical protein